MPALRRIVVLAAFVLGLLVVFVFIFTSPSQFPSLYRQPIRVRLLAPPETGGYLSEFVESFAATKPQLGDGTSIEIELSVDFALPSARALASGETKTSLWLAANGSLIDYVNRYRHNLGAQQRDCKQLFASPLVLAFPARRESTALPGTYEYSWESMVNRSVAPSSTSARFRFAHGMPEYSSSGLTALLQLAFFAAGSHESLSAAYLETESAVARLREFESLVSQYGTKEPLLLARSLASDSTLQGTFVTEQQVIAFNARRERHQSLLRAHYSTAGSLWQDYTICLSDGDWVSAGQRIASRMIIDALSAESAQLAAERRGFRPSLHPLGHGGVFNEQLGVDPTKPTASVPPPSGEVVEQIVKLWPEIRHPAALMLVLDTSGSMEGAALRLAKAGVRQVAASAGIHDLKAFITFSSKPSKLTGFTEDGSSIFGLIDEAKSGGGSALYDTIRQSMEQISKPELSSYRKLIVVVTDGEDRNSDTSLPLLLDIVTERAASADIHLAIVAIRQGEEDVEDLRMITRAARGTFIESSLSEFERDIEELISGL